MQTTKTTKTTKKTPVPKPDASLISPITILDGLGPKTAQAFSKLGVFLLEDIFFLLPRRYEDRRSPKHLADLEPGNTECTVAIVKDVDEANNILKVEIANGICIQVDKGSVYASPQENVQ